MKFVVDDLNPSAGAGDEKDIFLYFLECGTKTGIVLRELFGNGCLNTFYNQGFLT